MLSPPASFPISAAAISWAFLKPSFTAATIVLQHFDIFRVDHLGFYLNVENFLPAVDHRRHHASPGASLDFLESQVFLHFGHLLLQRLNLLERVESLRHCLFSSD